MMLDGIQPWQCFTAMFLTFWAVSAYFDHFLMTLGFCIAFGVLAEIYVKLQKPSDGDEKDDLIKQFVEAEKQKLKLLEEQKLRQEAEIMEMRREEESLMSQEIASADKTLLSQTSDLLPTPNNEVTTQEHNDISKHDDDSDNNQSRGNGDESPPPPIPSRDYKNIIFTELVNVEQNQEQAEQANEELEENVIDCPPLLPQKDFDTREEVKITNESEEECPPPLPQKDFVAHAQQTQDSMEIESETQNDDGCPPALPEKDISVHHNDFMNTQDVIMVEEKLKQSGKKEVTLNEEANDIFIDNNQLEMTSTEIEDNLNLLIDHQEINETTSIQVNDNKTNENEANPSNELIDNIQPQMISSYIETDANLLIDFSSDANENSIDNVTHPLSFSDKSVSEDLDSPGIFLTKLCYIYIRALQIII